MVNKKLKAAFTKSRAGMLSLDCIGEPNKVCTFLHF